MAPIIVEKGAAGPGRPGAAHVDEGGGDLLDFVLDSTAVRQHAEAAIVAPEEGADLAAADRRFDAELLRALGIVDNDMDAYHALDTLPDDEDTPDSPPEEPVAADSFDDVLAIAQHVVADDLPRMCRRLQLSHHPATGQSRTVSCSSTNLTLGRFHIIWNRTVKGTCRQHVDCSVMLERSWFSNPEDADKAVYRWLALARFAARSDHVSAATALARRARLSQAGTSA